MRKARVIFVGLLLTALAACSVPGPGGAPDGIHDPYEATNRKVHNFNRRLDKGSVNGAGAFYVNAVPEGVQRNISNFADTYATPSYVVNQVLQGRPGRATKNTLRFVINATLGFGGLADVASDLGLTEDDTDFGETLHVWGAPEGAYQELPLLGPSTERDTAGRVVDLFTNPLSRIIPSPERYSGSVATYLDKLGDRAKYASTVDSILHDSADSYAQLRLIYLQNRRHELGYGTDEDSSFVDPDAIDTEGF
ncbi:VacJ family lipoprotein [Pacificoceanicola onchidii]|uniref:MlaA family lipoprotein n=1 Tax=Pacificoceanicola onchidii TaxID=2562685 RepID=UPI0010A2E3BD|nr:VacJ family lipoprotein [Pacificoceanicola onchidii]